MKHTFGKQDLTWVLEREHANRAKTNKLRYDEKDCAVCLADNVLSAEESLCQQSTSSQAGRGPLVGAVGREDSRLKLLCLSGDC